MNTHKIIGTAVLVLGTGAALAAAAVPAGPIAASPEPVAGIIRQAEAYATADPAAEQGLREAIRLCMSTAGFDYTPPKADWPHDLSADIGFKRLTVESAKATGYARNNPQRPHEPTPESAEGRLFADPDFNNALTGPAGTAPRTTVQGKGTTTGGCRGEAMTRIYGSPDNYMLATGIAEGSFYIATNSAVRDPGVDKAVQNWETCMTGTPYSSYRNPQQAADAGTRAGGQEEIRIAVTDAVCRDKTGFHAALDAVLDKYLTTRMQELAPEIEKVRAIRRTAAGNAAVLGAAATR